MLHWLLTLNLVSGPVPLIIWGVALASALALLIRPLKKTWVIRAAIGIVAGVAAGYLLVSYVNAANVFGVPMPQGVQPWVMAGIGLLGLAIVSLWGSRWWRKVVAVVAVISSLLVMTIGINTAFGLTRTPGEILGINTLPGVGNLPRPTGGPLPTRPLYETWKAPADMPAKGEVRALIGAERIPSSGGFTPRDASIYLPPAALVKDPPALPVMVLMMGLPGAPNPSAVQTALNAMTAKHHGLGPIVIVADQLGAQLQNPGCVDSKKYGGVETYLNVDVPNYIRAHLRVLPDAKDWTIAGYSNGGACAFMYAARYPQIWGNVATASGEPWAGYADPASVLGVVYGGDRTAYDANKPEAILTAHPGAYSDHYAVLSAGALDNKYGPLNKQTAGLFEAAGFHTTFYLVPNATHTGIGLAGGLTEAFSVLYPRWGLAAE
ncbi:alpha/beta hydrolase [Microbacterium sp. ASV81]|uniref:Alpha/beta hydrolase-fold protein n=1 Tax=Microbacterium capsulatum TaxID=3041921 RepID=A0ABU0XKI3_9MICO|nr:alpha/beta hydrolase-fold protein [Microbacterium sp. ASV81]MDQ4215648.1 alpha/beta hydrolase-fold protein [Microbacterium sp. ASV81]